MNIIGIDFASNPSRRKPVTCLRCSFDGDRLRAEKLERWPDLSRFEEELKRPGPWIAGIDFPFGQARRFIETIEWPRDWLGYVRQAKSLGREGFRHALDAYRAPRPDGDKEHRRKTDKAAGSVSPQKLYGVPVGLMFLEGAPRLAASGVTIPHLKDGDPDRNRSRGVSRGSGAKHHPAPKLQTRNEEETVAGSKASAPRHPRSAGPRRHEGTVRVRPRGLQRAL